MSAWTLQKLSRGRFTLGLGTQVKAHIERRFGLPWSPAGPWIREYVNAVRAVWDCWQNGTKLDVKGPHYNINLMVPLFNPGPIEHPRIPIQLAAVNQVMSQIVGEVADGLRPHPVCTPSYIAEVMLPAVRAGAAKSGRSLEQFQVCMKPLVATAATEEELAKKIVDVRARISFYASTPQYRAAFAHHGLGDLADELKLLSRAQRWEEMPRFITDDILHTFVTVGTYDQIARRLLDRYSGVVTHCEFSIPVNGADDKDRLRDLAKTIQGESVDRARKAIVALRANRRGSAKGAAANPRYRAVGRSGPGDWRPRPSESSSKSEAAADEVEEVALAGLGQPQEALAAEQARRPVVQEFLEAGDRERPVAFEGQ